MISSRHHERNWILLTGATGLLGSAMLAELLARGMHVLCLVRAGTPAEARERLAAALEPWGCHAQRFLEGGKLVAIRGDVRRRRIGLDEELIQRLGGWVGSVVHAAGSTAFSRRTDPALFQINIDGTREVFELAARWGCTDWHLISTAFVCGRCDRADEALSAARPDFRNDYELAKWTAEHESRQSASLCGATLTTYRPSVVVGHSQSGVTTRFSGIYRVFRATAIMARLVDGRSGLDRGRIPLRIPAKPSARPNLVFVDDVAREFAELFERRESRGHVFHMTHPEPPSNRDIQTALEAYYDIAGGAFIGSDAPLSPKDRNAFEEVFYGVVRDTEPYLVESPVFERARTNPFVSRPPTPWSRERLHRLIQFADRSGWRRSGAGATPVEDAATRYEDYFMRFMPRMHRVFRLSSLTALDLDVRYVIGEDGASDWFCGYRGGWLVRVGPTNGAQPDVTYRISPSAFWNVVSGREAAAGAFLSGESTIEGDLERGLKFSVVLQEFVRQFPYGGLDEP